MDSSRNFRRHPVPSSRLAGRFAIRGGIVFGLAAFVLCAGSCIRQARRAAVPASTSECTAFAAQLSRTGLSEMTSRGRVTIDVNQYRVRGRYFLLIDDGTVTFEFHSTGIAGGGVEDVVVALAGDTLRVLDRERGEYYEGDEVEKLVAESSDVPVTAAEVVRRVAALPPACQRLAGLETADTGSKGLLDGMSFEVSVSGGRITSAKWETPFPDGDDRLEVTYRWDGNRLSGMTIFAPAQRWRVKLDATDKP